ncbi:hypothetical protein GCM10009079_41140 [Ralstonia mannitolilytica]
MRTGRVAGCAVGGSTAVGGVTGVSVLPEEKPVTVHADSMEAPVAPRNKRRCMGTVRAVRDRRSRVRGAAAGRHCAKVRRRAGQLRGARLL